MMKVETALPVPRKKGGGDGKAKAAETRKPQKENIKGGGNVKAKSSTSKRSSRREATLKVNRGRGTK
jgi:hypothetical protein